MTATTTSWLLTIASLAGTALLGAVGYLVRESRNELKQIRRHLQALMFSEWRTFWRVDQLEDWAHDRFAYSPPRSMPEWPFTEDP